MSTASAHMKHVIDPAGDPVVVLGGDAGPVRTVTELFDKCPELRDTADPGQTAAAVNFLAMGYGFDLIDDPAAFKAAYLERLAGEDPAAPWSEFQPKLHDYGTPDFDAILAPYRDGARLVYFAANTHLGVPYRIEVDCAAPQVRAGNSDYIPLPLTPIPQAAPEPTAGD